jgi:hypothetical protein
LVVALPRIDSIEVQGSNLVVSEGKQNTNVDPMLSHEETTNVPSTSFKIYEDVQGEVQTHDPNIYKPPPPSQMPSLSSIQATVVPQTQVRHPWTKK